MRATLAQVSTLNASFADDVREYAAGHCDSLEVWLTKLEHYLRQHSLAEVRALLSDAGMQIPVASFQGGLLDSQAEARREAWDLFGRRLDLCRELNIETIVVACDVREPLQQQMLDRVQASLVQVAQAAGQRGLRAALEFQASSSFGNNLQTAAAMVGEVASPHLGICLDLFHYYTGPSKIDDLRYLGTHNLFHVQLCDLADVPREIAQDAQRILPGEGDIQVAPILEYLRSIEYRGCVSIELLNPQIWQVGPRQFGEIAMTALRRLLGQASMGPSESPL